jgi:hypothetical protein
VLGVSGGIWFPFMRVVCFLFGVRLIVNVDGVEWRRKGGLFRNLTLYCLDRVAQLFAHVVVYDNAALLPYVARYKRQRARLIEYPGDHVSRMQPTRASTTEPLIACLTICRIEPENNCDLLLAAAAEAHVAQYIFVGNWCATAYGRRLQKHYGGMAGFSLLDPRYDQREIGALREGCTVYLHGHSVGGTNPSLVEMLFYDCGIAAFDCAFNRATAGESAVYFGSRDELVFILRSAPLSVSKEVRLAARRRYSRRRIAGLYVDVATRRV